MTLARRREWLILLLVALTTRAITLGNPIVHADEQFYLVAARLTTQGGWPYVDWWDRKPVGLFLLYLPPALLPWRAAVFAYQAMALAAASGTAALIAALARRTGAGAGATLAGVAYLVLVVLAEGQGGQSPIFYNALVAGAALLILARRTGWAALLLGLALQVKGTVAFEALFLLGWALHRDWRERDRPLATLARAAGWGALVLAPTLIAAGVFAAAGHGAAWLYANVLSILHRQPDPWPERLGNAAGLVAILSPLVAVALRHRPRTPEQRFLLGWLFASLAGIAVFGGWYDHYALPAMVPACAGAAGALGDRPGARRRAAAVLALVALAGQGLLLQKRWTRGTPAQFDALVAAVGRGPGCLWVQSGETMLYAATDRCRPSRYIFPSHLFRARESGAIGVDQALEIRRILATRPAVIVMRPPYRGERADLRALVTARLRRDYREAVALPLGSNTVRVFRRR